MILKNVNHFFDRVGAELVCDAIILHGNDAQKEKYVKPLLS
ncbi:hypothetical protein [Desulfobacula sp.]|nr:hypothetical protein [Desulfobacula sp.]